MKQNTVLERDAALSQLTHAAAPAHHALNVTVIYHDAQTLAWAREVTNRVTKLGGNVRATWWKISDLVEPGVLAGAVSMAMRADVIVTAIDVAEGLPFPFNVWVDTWLPNRLQTAGCLVALLGRTEPANGCFNQSREYLRAVAKAGRFQFLVEERLMPVPPVVRPAARCSRANLHAIEMRPLAGVGRGVVHRAA
jgi:hypothetical protein